MGEVMMRAKQVGVLVLCLSSLGGCAIAPQQGNFSCPIDQVTGCLDVASADHQQTKVDKVPHLTGNQRGALHTVTAQGLVYRTRETTRRIWFAPYEDEQGNWHEASIVYVVDKPAQWQVVSIKPKTEPQKEPDSLSTSYEWEEAK